MPIALEKGGCCIVTTCWVDDGCVIFHAKFLFDCLVDLSDGQDGQGAVFEGRGVTGLHLGV